MKLLFFCTLLSFSWSHVLTIDVPAPYFDIRNGTLEVSNGAYLNSPGEPAVPCKVVTIAVPPGAKVESVTFSGTRTVLCAATVPATMPPIPLTNINAHESLYKLYTQTCTEINASDNEFPESYGRVISTGGIRKYSVVTAACHHFSYNPVKHILYYSPSITVEITYAMPVPDSKRAQYWQRLMNDITADAIAQRLIFNWDEACCWYATDTPRQANGYCIIIPSAIQESVDTLVAWRQSQGYDVHVITKEYIETNVAGNDLPQKIRNYLRANMADIEYVLLVGFSTDIPWRSMVPFNNDPDSPWNHADYSPIPSDLYYAELSDPDSLSWNSDGDSYYGEVFDENFQLVGEDDPDYHADVCLGRIPFSTQSTIEDICNKMIAFDSNTDVVYKTASLLAGGIYYYANENNGGNARMDGADYTEQLMNDTVLQRSNAVYLYEKGGLGPCSLSCTDSLTRTNMIAYWQNKGIMYECHHGNVNIYARKVWAWDDGDSIPENNEIQWPTCLQSSDVYQLDNTHPATSFLRSCLCGKPEETGLGALLLYRGAASVISSSRISWSSSSDYGGIPYHFYRSLLKDTTESNGIIGHAYDIGRTIFMDITSFWLPAYHYNLFGDPALKQLGRETGILSTYTQPLVLPFTLYPNPVSRAVTIQMTNVPDCAVTFDVYDESGRFVHRMFKGSVRNSPLTFPVWLPAGVYFVECKPDKGRPSIQKIIVIE